MCIQILEFGAFDFVWDQECTPYISSFKTHLFKQFFLAYWMLSKLFWSIFSWHLSVRPSVNYYVFDFSFRTVAPIFNQTWQKAAGDSSLLKLRQRSLSRGDEFLKFVWFFQKSSSQKPFDKKNWNYSGSILTWCRFKFLSMTPRGRLGHNAGSIV